MSRRAPLLLLVAMIFGSGSAHAALHSTTDLELIGVYQNLEEDIAGARLSRLNGFLKIEEQIRYKKKWFTFAADPQVRAVGNTWDPDATQRRLYGSSIRAPDRGLPLETHLERSDQSEFQASFERLSFGFKTENIEFQAGRQAFSLGVLKFVPIWNRFSTNLPLPGIFFQFPTRDGFSLRAQYGFWSTQVFSIFTANPATDDHVIENSFTFSDFEFRVLAGVIEDHRSLGFAGTANVLGGTFRIEQLSIGLDKGEDYVSQVGLGYERAIDEMVSIVLESYSLTDGATNESEYDIRKLSSRRPLLAHDYLFTQLKFQLSSLLSLAPEAIWNLSDSSTVAGFEAQYSLSDNSDLLLKILSPTGSRGKEFSTYAATAGSNGPLGMSQVVSLTYHLFF
jgi:hypothetical protein